MGLRKGKDEAEVSVSDNYDYLTREAGGAGEPPLRGKSHHCYT
jgi:hypothetical protein